MFSSQEKGPSGVTLDPSGQEPHYEQAIFHSARRLSTSAHRLYLPVKTKRKAGRKGASAFELMHAAAATGSGCVPGYENSCVAKNRRPSSMTRRKNSKGD